MRPAEPGAAHAGQHPGDVAVQRAARRGGGRGSRASRRRPGRRRRPRRRSRRRGRWRAAARRRQRRGRPPHLVEQRDHPPQSSAGVVESAGSPAVTPPRSGPRPWRAARYTRRTARAWRSSGATSSANSSRYVGVGRQQDGEVHAGERAEEGGRPAAAARSARACARRRPRREHVDVGRAPSTTAPSPRGMARNPNSDEEAGQCQRHERDLDGLREDRDETDVEPLAHAQAVGRRGRRASGRSLRSAARPGVPSTSSPISGHESKSFSVAHQRRHPRQHEHRAEQEEHAEHERRRRCRSACRRPATPRR